MRAQAPPDHLTESSKELWRSLVPSRCKSTGRIALLLSALEARDRAEGARQLIADEGAVIPGDGDKMARVHPAVRVEKDARGLFLAAWRELRLGFEELVDP